MQEIIDTEGFNGVDLSPKLEISNLLKCQSIFSVDVVRSGVGFPGLGPEEIIVEGQVHIDPEVEIPILTGETRQDTLDSIVENLDKIRAIEENISEADLISGVVETSEINNRVYIMANTDSVPLDKLIDNGSSCIVIRKSA